MAFLLSGPSNNRANPRPIQYALNPMNRVSLTLAVSSVFAAALVFITGRSNYHHNLFSFSRDGIINIDSGHVIKFGSLEDFEFGCDEDILLEQAKKDGGEDKKSNIVCILDEDEFKDEVKKSDLNNRSAEAILHWADGLD